MKLDISHMKYLTSDDFRVLQAMELGSRNHELVPTQMIASIGGLKSVGGFKRAISDLAKFKLINRLRNAKYEGFRLTYSGYDYLALRAMLNRDTLYSIGTTIGVGKESDIYSVADRKGKQKVLKIHRLGRTSFTTVKRNRDYLKNKQTSNWMYLSRLAAQKEYEFMSVLYKNNFNVPEPHDASRHCILMEWIDGITMKNLRVHDNHKKLYSYLMKFIVRLASHGLIHCDFNEFNIIIKRDAALTDDDPGFVVIDFPQCVSIDHPDAKFYFDRDVEGIRSFFARKFKYKPANDSTMFDTDGYGDGYRYAYPSFKRDVKREASLDEEVQASGFTKSKSKNNNNRDLEAAFSEMRSHFADEEEYNYSEGSEFSSEEEEDDEEDEEDEDEGEYEEEYESSDLEEPRGDSNAEQEENERIIEALTKGTENLKMDKLGNYILE